MSGLLRLAIMNPLVLIGGLVVGGGLLLLASGSKQSAPAHRQVIGLPTINRVTYKIATTGQVDVLVDGAAPVGNYLGAHPIGGGGGQDYEKQQIAKQARIVQDADYARKSIMAVFAMRRMSLPADANKFNPDQYSKGYFALPTWLLDGNITGYNYRIFDEFGRLKPGHVGFGGSIADSFKRLLDNPLGQLVVQAAILYATGPAGLAAYGAVRAYAERGAEMSLQDAALASARTAAVGYCGVACGMAFDFGVGVASGDSVDTAAENAILGELTPEQRAYYEQGKQAYASLG